MVPLKITIKDFRSFKGPDEIIFPETPMLCITGHNGAGKSTIIEAIFWALFGQHREGLGKECIRTGAQSCSVEFQFLLGERRYKIIRTMGRNKKARIMVKEGEEFIPAIQSEKVTDVDNFIKKTLGAGYKEIRVASAFMQGDSNRFSKLQPGERQKTLTQLLGIGVLEEIRQKAVTNANIIHAQAEQIQKRMGELKNALESSNDPRPEIEKIASEIKTIEDENKTREKQMNELISQRTELLTKSKQRENLIKQLEEIHGRLTEISQEKKELLSRESQLMKFLEQKDEIEKRYQEYLELAEREKNLSPKLKEKHLLERELSICKENLQKKTDERNRRLAELSATVKALETEYTIAHKEAMKISEYESQLSELDALKKLREKLEDKAQKTNEILIHIEKLRARVAEREEEIKRKCKEIENKIAMLGDVETEIQKIIQEMENLREQADKLAKNIEQGELLKQEIANISARNSAGEQKISQINETIQQLDEKIRLIQSADKPRCPLCDSPLMDEHRRKILGDFENQRKNLFSERKNIADELKENSERINLLYKRLDEIEKQKIALEQLNRKNSELTKLLTEAENKKKLKNELQQEKEIYTAQIREKSYASSEMSQISSLEAKISEIGFSQGSLNDIIRKIEKLTGIEQLYRSAQENQERAKRLEEEILTQRQKYKDLESSPISAEDEKKIGELTQMLLDYDWVEEEYFTVKSKLDNLASAQKLYMDLSLSRQETENIRKQVKKLDGDEKNLLHHKTKIEEELEEYEEIETKLHSTETEIAKKETEIEKNKRKLEELQNTLSQLRVLEARRKDWSDEISTLEANYKKASSEEKLLRTIIDICGPGGAQNWLMSQKLSIIEEDTNEILSNIAPGIVVKLKPEEDEKVSVNVTADGVDRKYESLSGGEAFRVDFALRLAISRAIANRSGFPLRTLIIDEGFGTQDKEGIDALVKSLLAIQNEFDRIIVITHVDMLADAFPIKLNVKREKDGFSKVGFIM